MRGECISCGLVGDVKRRFYLCVKKKKKSIPGCQTLGAVVGTMGVGESGSRGVWECRLFDFLSTDTQTNKASHLSTAAVVIMLSPVQM